MKISKKLEIVVNNFYKQFLMRQALYGHTQTYINIKKFKCNDCGYASLNNSQLNIHIHYLYTNNLKTYKYQFFEKRFKCKNDAKRNEIIH